ncbi:MAG: hypothetical protein ACXW32_09630 [Limisphaerales bacterium]
MRTLLTLIVFLCVLRLTVTAAIVARWDFNSIDADSDPTTGAIIPAEGLGDLILFGGASNIFGSVGGGNNSDPNETDDSQMRVTRSPAQSTNNKGAGIEFQVSTRGIENLKLAWDQYNSATASRYWRVLFSTNGVDWIEHAVIVQTSASKWLRHSVDLRDRPELHDRDLVQLRIASEFESTATGGGLDEYRAIGEASNYSTSGSWWIDYVTISGRALGVANALPTISEISDQVVVEGSGSDEIEFTISDAETIAENLIVSARVSVLEVITNLTISGTGLNRTLEFQATRPGATEITIKVEDEEGNFVEASFTVTVLPKEPEPSIAPAFVLWNFNSQMPDMDAATGNIEPSFGAGEVLVMGISATAFGTVGQGRTSDPAESDNSMLRLAGFPRQGTSNQTAGVEIRASTAGFRNIGIVWDQYNSATASRYWAVQYTTNGSEFLDLTIVTNTTASTWLRRRFVSLASISGVKDNPQFGVRIVSSAGADGAYEAVTMGSSYGTTGTLWLDMVGLTGEAGSPSAPTISCSLEGGEIRIAWPKTSEIYLLEMREDLVGTWQAVDGIVEELGEEFKFSTPLQANQRFFRLRKADGE